MHARPGGRVGGPGVLPGSGFFAWAGAAAGGRLIRAGPWRRGLPRVFRAQRVAQGLRLYEGIR